MRSLKQPDDDPAHRPGRRDRNQDEPPREDPDPDPEPTQPVGDPEPAVSPIKTSDEPTRPLRAPSPAEVRTERAVCKMCGRSFDSTQGLVDHEITVHPNVNVPPKRNNSEEESTAA